MATKFRQPPGFIATGKGFANKANDFPATASNANGIFTNLGEPTGGKWRTMYTFVTGVTTGWQVAGVYGQSVGARTWYPRNLSQIPLTVRGQVANQYEYDRLVEFVEQHHNYSVDIRTAANKEGTSAVDFKLLPFRIPIFHGNGTTTYRYIHQAMHVRGYILDIEAGHEAFRFSPTWTMQIQISNDFLQEPVNVQGELNKALYSDYIQLFGNFYKGPKITGAPPKPPSSTDGFSPGPGGGGRVF